MDTNSNPSERGSSNHDNFGNMMKQSAKKQIAFFITFVIFASIIAGGIYALNRSNSGDDSDATSQSSEVSETSTSTQTQFNTYVSPDSTFQFRYPSDWKIEVEEKTSSLFPITYYTIQVQKDDGNYLEFWTRAEGPGDYFFCKGEQPEVIGDLDGVNIYRLTPENNCPPQEADFNIYYGTEISEQPYIGYYDNAFIRNSKTGYVVIGNYTDENTLTSFDRLIDSIEIIE